MAPQQQKAELLRGYKIGPHPELPTVALIQLDTDNTKYFFLATREILTKLSSEFSKRAAALEPMH